MIFSRKRDYDRSSSNGILLSGSSCVSSNSCGMYEIGGRSDIRVSSAVEEVIREVELGGFNRFLVSTEASV